MLEAYVADITTYDASHVGNAKWKRRIISVMFDLRCEIHGEAKNDKSTIIWEIEKDCILTCQYSQLIHLLHFCQALIERSGSCYTICG